MHIVISTFLSTFVYYIIAFSLFSMSMFLFIREFYKTTIKLIWGHEDNVVLQKKEKLVSTNNNA
jgi:hypothetical protein